MIYYRYCLSSAICPSTSTTAAGASASKKEMHIHRTKILYHTVGLLDRTVCVHMPMTSSCLLSDSHVHAHIKDHMFTQRNQSLLQMHPANTSVVSTEGMWLSGYKIKLSREQTADFYFSTAPVELIKFILL